MFLQVDEEPYVILSTVQVTAIPGEESADPFLRCSSRRSTVYQASRTRMLRLNLRVYASERFWMSHRYAQRLPAAS